MGGGIFEPLFRRTEVPQVAELPRDDAWYIARASERRSRRAAKRAENQRRTEEGKRRATA